MTTILQKRIWVKSDVIEIIDGREIALLKLVYDKIVFYYEHLHGTRPCYKYPLSLSRLMKLCNRSGHAVRSAIWYLTNTVPLGSPRKPLIFYDRVQAARNKSHRPYRIFLRGKYD